MEFYNTMGCRQEKYNLLRGQLDTLGYNQPLSMESLPLVHILISDLTLYKDRYIRYKDIAQKALQKSQDLESMINPLQIENEHLRKENNYLHYEILQAKEHFDKNLKGLRTHISELESAYSDLEFANMEQVTKIGALEEQIFSQNKKLVKYEGGNGDNSNTNSKKARDPEEFIVPTLPTISSVNNYISDILSHKSPQELAKEIEKLKAERKKLADSIDFYQNQILSRDEEIKRLSQKPIRSIPNSASPPSCRCHFMELGENVFAETDYDIKTKFNELNKKLQSSAQTTVTLAEQVQKLERKLEQQTKAVGEALSKEDDLICICSEIKRLQDLQNRCYCHNGIVSFHGKERKSKNKEDTQLIQLLRMVSNENDELKKELKDSRNKAFQNMSSYKELLNENKVLRQECTTLNDQLMSAQKETSSLKEINASLQKMIEDIQVNKRCMATKSVSVSFPDSVSPKSSDCSAKKRAGPVSQNKVSSSSSRSGSSSEKNAKPKVKDITPDFIGMKNDIIKEVESVCKQFISTKPNHSQEEELKALTMELEKVKAERNYYSKEYHSLQDKLISLQKNRESSPKVFYQKEQDDKHEYIHRKETYPVLNDVPPAASQIMIERLSKQNELFQEQIKFLEEKINGLTSEKEFQLRGQDNDRERNVYVIENQRLQNEISNLRQRLIELQHELHYEKCESKMIRLKLEDSSKFMEVEKNKSLSRAEELIAKIQYLEGTVDNLNKKIENLLSDNSCLQSQYNNLRSVNEHLERSLKNADGTYQKCEHELNDALRRIELLEEEKNELTFNISKAKKEAQLANDKMLVIAKEKDNLMEKLDMKTVEVSRLEKENNRQYCLINQLEEKISRLNCQVIRKNNEEQKAENEIITLKRELEICMEAKSRLLNENRNLQSDMASLIKDNEIIFNENENYKKEILKLKEQLQKYVEEVRRVEEILEAKEMEREEMLEQFKTLSAEAMDLENNMQTLEKEKKRTSDSLRVAQEKLNNLNATVENKDSLVTGLEEQVMELSNELYSLKNEFLSINEENSRLKQEVEASNALLASLDHQKRKSESNVQVLDKQIQQMSLGMDESELLKKKLTSQIEAQKEVIATLENAVSSSRKEAMHQSLENQCIQQKVDELQSSVRKLQEQLSGMNETLMKYQETCEQYKNENLQLQREIINEKFEKVRAEETQSFSTSL